MKLQNIVHHLMLEAAITNAIYNRIYPVWSQEKPDITKEDIQSIYDEFKAKQNGLSPNKAEVRTFLYRFDGNHGYSRFEPENIKDITKYTYQQIMSLLDEYNDVVFDDTVVNDAVFQGKDTKPNDERIEASKMLWNSESYAIVNEDGFRVYAIPDQGTSMKFGYYAELMNKRIKTAVGGGNSPWCVTWRGDNGTNMWGTYRPRRTFYFVIDESKDNLDKYYLGALQKTTPEETNTGYRLTSVINDGDNAMTWQQIVAIYPKIDKYRDLIVLKQYSDDELKIKNVVGQITETPNSKYEFKRVERPLKKAFIEAHGVLKNPDSWAHMDTKLRNLYITNSTSGDVLSKFSTFDFISEVKKVGNELTALNNRLRALGKDGISYIIDNIMSREFKVRRTSVMEGKKHLKIYESKNNGKCGIYNTRKLEWVNFNGVEYLPQFTMAEADSFADENKNVYLLEIYKDGGRKFYYGYERSSPKGRGYIMSEESFNQLIADGKINLDRSKGPKIGKVEPVDADIEEMKKGY